jgi:2-C-methyl-D-erythritol 2,4-cyclodiphosphate synthase
MSDELSLRIGHGFDAHRFEPGETLVLGGVEIEHPQGLAGHSDADVLCHAVADALLGAMGMGDLGRHFPPDDPRWKGTSSLEFLRRIRGMIEKAGATVGQVDAILYLEAPKVGPHLDQMQARMAEALGVSATRVSVKATTTEGLGFIGRKEGAAASAVALVSRG